CSGWSCYRGALLRWERPIGAPGWVVVLEQGRPVQARAVTGAPCSSESACGRSARAEALMRAPCSGGGSWALVPWGEEVDHATMAGLPGRARGVGAFGGDDRGLRRRAPRAPGDHRDDREAGA